MKQTKKQIIELIKTQIVYYARPKNMGKMAKTELQLFYNEAKSWATEDF